MPMRWNIFFCCRCCIRIVYPEKNLLHTYYYIRRNIMQWGPQNERLFLFNKSFFQVLYSLPVYIILYRRYAINWKKFYFSSQDKGPYMESSWTLTIIFSIRYNPQTTLILNLIYFCSFIRSIRNFLGTIVEKLVILK